MKAYLFAALAGTAIASVAQAQFSEVEPNDTKLTANPVVGITPGGTITGVSTASTGTGVDYFRVQTSAAPLGLYRYDMILSGNNGVLHSASLRGSGQNGAAAGAWPLPGGEGTHSATEATLQTGATISGTTSRLNSWYGFGRAGEVYYRVNGSSTTTAGYTATLQRTQITPVQIGSYQQGFISMNWLGQGHSSDTDMWVYDSNFNAIRGYGNDDESVNGGSPGTGATLQSYLRREYLPGIYYIAVTNFNLANSMGSPSDDDFRTGSMSDFADVVMNSSTTTGINMTFTIADSAGTSLQVANTKAGAFDINWFCFEVVPTPGSAMLLGMGGLVALRRRR
jgi:hypothetical protein